MKTLLEKPLQFNKNITLSNDGGQLSNDAGMLLLFEFLHKINFDQMIQDTFKMEDSRAYCTHEYTETLIQMIVQLIAGYSQDTSANRLRMDPIFQEGLEKEQLASQSTLSRFINHCTQKQVDQLKELAKKLTNRGIEQANVQHMILDVDSTHSDTFGNQEKTDYNAHYGTNGYHPLVAFDGQTGLFLDAELRSGNVYTSNKAEHFLAHLIDQHTQHPCDMFLLIRGDSGFAKPEIYSLCEKECAKYLIRLKSNKKLKDMAEQRVLYGTDTDSTVSESQYFTLTYQAGSWKTSREVFVKVTRQAGELLFSNYEFVVSNFTGLDAETIFKLYQNRGTMENYIKEIKNGFSFDKTDSSTFVANQVRMMMACVAYNLVHLMKEVAFPEKEKRATISTIRFKLFHLAGRVVRHARKIRVRLASAHVYEPLFWEILNTLQNNPLLC